MKVVKLTKKAQDIVNQIMSADTIDIEHGPHVQRISYGNIGLKHDKLVCVINVDGDLGEMHITNDTLNEAEVVNGIIEIQADHIKENEYGDMTITLYKLNKISAN